MNCQGKSSRFECAVLCFLAARSNFNYVVPPRRTIVYRGRTYDQLRDCEFSRVGYYLGVASRPFRVLSSALDIPEDLCWPNRERPLADSSASSKKQR